MPFDVFDIAIAASDIGQLTDRENKRAWPYILMFIVMGIGILMLIATLITQATKPTEADFEYGTLVAAFEYEDGSVASNVQLATGDICHPVNATEIASLFVTSKDGEITVEGVGAPQEIDFYAEGYKAELNFTSDDFDVPQTLVLEETDQE